MKKFVNILLVAILAIVSVFAVACNEEPTIETYWDIQRFENSAGDPLSNYAVLYLTRDSSPIKEIWLNVDGVSKEEVGLSIVFGHTTTTTNYKDTNVKFLKSKTNDADGWVRLLTGVEYEYNYVKLSIQDTMKVNEIVFIDKNDKVITVSLSLAGQRASATSSSKNEYTADALKKAVEEGTMENTALSIVDEQDKFDLNKVRDIYKSVYGEDVTDSSSAK